MIQAVQLRNFGVSNVLFSNAAAHSKSCCQKIQEVFQKAWKAFKRAIDALLKPCYRCWHKDTHKVENISHQSVEQVHVLPPDQVSKGLLFEILDNTGASKGYLIGTFHKFFRAMPDCHPSILEKIHDSTHLGVEGLWYDAENQRGNARAAVEWVFEFFNDPGLDQNALAQNIEQIRLACVRLGKVTPHEILSQEQAVLRAIHGLPENEANKWKNRLNFMFYQENLRSRLAHEGLDSQLVAVAQRSNQPIIPLELESIRNEFMKLWLTKLYRELLGKNVDEIIRLQACQEQEDDQLIDAWKRGDYVEFCRLREIRDSDEVLQNAQDPILLRIIQRFRDVFRQRNIQMATTIDQFIREGRGKLFAAVGCYHLPRSDGVIELLRQRGWTVQQVATPQIQVPEVPLQAAAGA